MYACAASSDDTARTRGSGATAPCSVGSADDPLTNTLAACALRAHEPLQRAQLRCAEALRMLGAASIVLRPPATTAAPRARPAAAPSRRPASSPAASACGARSAVGASAAFPRMPKPPSGSPQIASDRLAAPERSGSIRCRVHRHGGRAPAAPPRISTISRTGLAAASMARTIFLFDRRMRHNPHRRRGRRVRAFDHPRPFAPLLPQPERRLQQVPMQPRRGIQAVQAFAGQRAFEPAVADQSPTIAPFFCSTQA